MSELIPSVGYARRSTEKQEASIPEQQKAVEQYAGDHGYQILRWYVDDGISGDATDKRHQFLRMLQDAQEVGDFKSILVWDQDRFGRFDPQEAAYRTYPLARAGIFLVTVDKGPIDWKDFVQWLTYSVNQHAKHQFLKDLSKNVLRGQAEAAKENGSWIGRIPRGYTLEGPRKHKQLVPGKPAEVAVVRRIFAEFVDDGRSLTEIADRLNQDGVPSGKGGTWRYDAVRAILENVAYVGTFRFNVSSRSKYSHCKGNRILPGGARGRNDEADWIVKPDHHEPLIDRATFKQAQRLLKRQKMGKRSSGENNPFLLSGLVRCGACGGPTWGYLHRGVPRYECARQRERGDCPGHGCSIREDALLRFVADYIEGEFASLDGDKLAWRAERKELKPGDLPKAFAKLKRMIRPPAQPLRDRERLEKQAKALAGDIDKARRNLVLLDAANIPAAQQQIRELEAGRQRLELELRRRPPSEEEVNAEVMQLLRDLYWLEIYFRLTADPQERDLEAGKDGCYLTGDFRPVLRQFLRRVESITVWTRKEGTGTGTRHTFERGELVLCKAGDGADSLVRGVTGEMNLHRLVQSEAAYR
jgi:DNA invertase Pin-like site-specific DNA recombinase